jgi:hypothetical protein
MEIELFKPLAYLFVVLLLGGIIALILKQESKYAIILLIVSLVILLYIFIVLYQEGVFLQWHCAALLVGYGLTSYVTEN